MSTQTTTNWQCLAPDPKGRYHQLMVKGTNFRARDLYLRYMDWPGPSTLDDLADIFHIPIEAIQEAIAYCQSNPPELQLDTGAEDRKIQELYPEFKNRLWDPAKHGTDDGWLYLDRKPGSAYKQLFVRGRRIAARTLYGEYMSEGEPSTPEAIVEDYDLPLDVVLEAIAYYQTNPPEIQLDWEEEEARAEARGMNDPNYNGKPNLLTSQERAGLYE